MTEKANAGARIRGLREKHSMTIEDLAERSSLPVELVSSIESGAAAPDLAPLVKLARALGVRLGTFLDDAEKLGPVVQRANAAKSVVRFSGERKNTGMDFMSLAAGKSGRHMEPFLIDVDAEVSDAAPSSHEGEEFLYVLSGSLLVVYGKETYELNEGDSLYYDSIVPHRVSSSGKGPARILAVVYTPF